MCFLFTQTFTAELTLRIYKQEMYFHACFFFFDYVTLLIGYHFLDDCLYEK